MNDCREGLFFTEPPQTWQWKCGSDSGTLETGIRRESLTAFCRREDATSLLEKIEVNEITGRGSLKPRARSYDELVCSRTRNLRACVQWDLVSAINHSFQIWIPCSRHLRDLDYLMSGWRWRGTYFPLSTLRTSSSSRLGWVFARMYLFFLFLVPRSMLLSIFIDPIPRFDIVKRYRTSLFRFIHGLSR